ncbi:type VI secretion system contractile sheath small subunit [Pseudooceanicola nanhaiensis]|uniref:type VI secretion system contractile sheath small subunit n=1 Tax=Pseudooceanicola nanhaiensis TaxID=375761 RepID=UPI0035129F5A
MSDSQKFVSRNRAPRVQIEYDVELYGAEKKVQLPFVMGVLADLSGKAEVPAVGDRQFLAIDADTFDDRMKAMGPRAQFSVPNTLTGEGSLEVDLTFEKMADFSPEAIARKIGALAPLLEARRQLTDLLAYMDGKAGAETLIETLLASPEILRALGGPEGASPDTEAALAGLRDRLPETPAADETDATLSALAATVPAGATPGPGVEDILSGIAPAEERAPDDSAETALNALRAARPEETPAPDDTGAALSALRAAAPGEPDAEDGSAGTLDALRATQPDTPEAADDTAEVLSGLERVTEEAPGDESEDVLSGIARVSDDPVEDGTADILSGIERVSDEPPGADTAAVLSGIARVSEDTSGDDGAATLSDLSSRMVLPEDPGVEDDRSATLSDLAARPVATEEAGPDVAGILDRIEATPEAEEDDLDALLPDLEGGTGAAAGGETGGIDAHASDPGDAEDDAEHAADEADAAADDLDALLSDLDGGSAEGAALSGGGAGEADAEALDALLSGLDDDADQAENAAPEPAAGEDDLDALLSDPEGDAGETDAAAPEAEGDDLDALLSDLAGADDGESAGGDAGGLDDLDALLSDLGDVEAENSAPGPEGDEGDLDALLSDPEGDADEDASDADAAEPEAEGDLDALLSDLEGANAGVTSGGDAGAADADAGDLDSLLSDLGSDAEDISAEAGTETAAADEDGVGDLDAMLEELGGAEEAEPESDEDDLDALLSDLGGGADEGAAPAPEEPGATGDGLDDLDALLADLDDDKGTAPAAEDGLGAMPAEVGSGDGEAAPANPAPVQSPFGTISAARPDRAGLDRRRFRMAVFGDFTGRAGRGLCAIGDDLAARPAIPLDVDTIDEVIEGFSTTLTLPIGKDGAGIDVRLAELDDLHPDELYDKVAIFDALSGLRQQLGTGSMAAKAAERLAAWGAAHDTPVRLPKRSASTSVPAGMRLSDFQRLIGDTTPREAAQGPADALIARIVGPHVVKAPDAGVAAMQGAVDEALSSAMRLVLHHPDFQAVEALWRSLDMLARRIETDSDLEIVLYDVSAAEIAADLAAQEDLSDSGLFRLLTGVIDPETGVGGFSALFGLYTFEETPPHAELLARLAQVAAHVDAPFFTALTPAYLETAKEDRHPLVAQAWDALRAMPEANYIGIASPRFLLRLPYGRKSDPCSAFDFEEFTPREGLSGMLWGNPVVLVAILLAAAHKKDGRAMEPGSVMSLGDMPFHYVTDRHGDQVALPCTERNLTSDPVQQSLGRGIMPVVSLKGRNEVRLASFRALGGETIAGPWSGEAPPPRPAPEPQAEVQLDVAAPPAEDTAAQDADLDDILAAFDDDTTDDAGPEDEMDPELAALLEDL